MKKKIKLNEIEVSSFVTKKNKMVGGGGSIPTGNYCPIICSEQTFCITDCCDSLVCR